MRILNADQVRTALPMQEAIPAMKHAYAALSAGQVEIPLRTVLSIRPQQATSLFMPAYLNAREDEEALTLKIVSLFPQNPSRGLALIQAAVIVLDPHSGQTRALLEGGSLTAIRTGAASGAATDLLARRESRVVTIFGAGTQGRTQLEAVCTVRDIETAWIVDPDPQRAAQFAADMRGHGPIPADIRIARDPQAALSKSDIVCTATTSATPVYRAEDIRPGTHINGVGSYTLAMIENPPELLQRASVYIDSRDAALAEAGEIVAAINRKLLFPAELTELGDLVRRQAAGRRSAEEITFFKSVGIAVQDALAAQVALRNAEAQSLGQEIPF